jgi:hypothetical protein
VKRRTEYNRIIDAMQENAPSAKIARRRVFSRPGRWMERRRGMGSARMNMSIRMFAPDVAVPCVSIDVLVRCRSEQKRCRGRGVTNCR